jgi:ribosomal protein S17E
MKKVKRSPMKSVLALAGKSGVGKSRTIKRVYDLLLEKYHNAIEVHKQKNLRVEVQVIIDINGKRVGIESRGDHESYVKKALNIFADAKCKVILCATKSDGNTLKAVDAFGIERGYAVTRIYKFGEPIESKQKQSNEKCAMEIMEKIEHLLLTA